jgi:hypothetical protein
MQQGRVKHPPVRKLAPSPGQRPYALGDRPLPILTVWGRFFRRNKKRHRISGAVHCAKRDPYRLGVGDSLADSHGGADSSVPPNGKDGKKSGGGLWRFPQADGACQGPHGPFLPRTAPPPPGCRMVNITPLLMYLILAVRPPSAGRHSLLRAQSERPRPPRG